MSDRPFDGYYVVREGFLLVLRQKRYRDLLAAGREHPHDTCAYARNAAEMRAMTAGFKGSIGWSAVADEVTDR